MHVLSENECNAISGGLLANDVGTVIGIAECFLGVATGNPVLFVLGVGDIVVSNI